MFGKTPDYQAIINEFAPEDRKALTRYFNDLLDIASFRQSGGVPNAMPGSCAVAMLILGGNQDLPKHVLAAGAMRPIRFDFSDQYPEANVERETKREALAKSWIAGDDTTLRLIGAQTLKEIASNRLTRASRVKAQAKERKEKEARDREDAPRREAMRKQLEQRAKATAEAAERAAQVARHRADALAASAAPVGQS